MGATQAQGAAADRAVLAVRAVDLTLRRVVRAQAGGWLEPVVQHGPVRPDSSSLIVPVPAPGRKPPHADMSAVFDAVAGGLGCSASTVRRAWVEARTVAPIGPRAQALVDLQTQAQAGWDRAVLPANPAPTKKAHKKTDRCKTKAAIDRGFQKR